MKRTDALAVVLFGCMTIGAKDCDPWAGWSNASTGSGGPTTTVTYCQTDPPLTCAAICFVVDMSGVGMPAPPSTPLPTSACSSGGPQAMLFLDDVQSILTCDPNTYPGMASYVVFPTFFFFAPQVTQTGNCTPPPALPETEPLSSFMN